MVIIRRRRLPALVGCAALAGAALGGGTLAVLGSGTGVDPRREVRARAAPVAGPASSAPTRGVAEASRGAAPPSIEGAEQTASPADDRFSNRPPRGAAPNLDPRDLGFLADLIEANGLDEASSARDWDDGDGRLEPIELGFQVWERGRLVRLHGGPHRYESFGYGIHTLPPSVADARALRVLDLHGNALRELPDAIGELDRLEELVLHENRLAALPASVERLVALRRLALARNALAALPDGIGALDGLEELHLSDNPLAALPDSLDGLRALRVLSLRGARLVALPAGLAALPALRHVDLAGNRIGCDPGAAAHAPERLARAVHGLARQECGS